MRRARFGFPQTQPQKRFVNHDQRKTLSCSSLSQMLGEEGKGARPGDIGAGLVVTGAFIAVETMLRAWIDVNFHLGPLRSDDIDIAERNTSVVLAEMKLSRHFRLVLREAHDGAAVIADRGRQA